MYLRQRPNLHRIGGFFIALHAARTNYRILFYKVYIINTPILGDATYYVAVKTGEHRDVLNMDVLVTGRLSVA